jgi:hypothetical protein
VQHNVPAESRTLIRCLHDAVAEGVIYDAGRGWYSSLAKAFTLEGAMHHLLGRFVTVVNVEAEAMETVWESLRDAGSDAWLNPRGKEAERFAVRERTAVVRRESRNRPSEEPLAPIEKLMVELCFEVRDLQLMALPEFHMMLASVASAHRIQMATLFSYAAERKPPLEELFGPGNQLTPPF